MSVRKTQHVTVKCVIFTGTAILIVKTRTRLIAVVTRFATRIWTLIGSEINIISRKVGILENSLNNIHHLQTIKKC